MNAATYRLRRLDPGKQLIVEGRRIEELWEDSEGVHRRDIGRCPLIGRALRIAFIDTHCELMWWSTTPVMEILDDLKDRIVFRTQKSTYELQIGRLEEERDGE